MEEKDETVKKETIDNGQSTVDKTYATGTASPAAKKIIDEKMESFASIVFIIHSLFDCFVYSSKCY